LKKTLKQQKMIARRNPVDSEAIRFEYFLI